MTGISKLRLTLVILACVGPSALPGADPTPSSSPAPAQPGRPARARTGGGSSGARVGMNLGLDDQQNQLFREALQKSQSDLGKLDQKLRAAQQELMQAILAESYDEKAVREKAEVAAKIQVEMALLRGQALATVAPTLKPEQREELVSGRAGPLLLTGGGMSFISSGGGPGNFVIQRIENAPGNPPGNPPPGGAAEPGNRPQPPPSKPSQ
jgi:Spy/CpxP family protein refolding chaperone